MKNDCIIMIADTLEAASRSLDNINEETAMDLANRLIQEKAARMFNDGQTCCEPVPTDASIQANVVDRKADRLVTELSQQIAANDVQVVSAPRFAYASAPAAVVTQPRQR